MSEYATHAMVFVAGILGGVRSAMAMSRGKTAAQAFRDLEAAFVDFGHAFLEAWPGRLLVWFCDRLAALIGGRR